MGKSGLGAIFILTLVLFCSSVYGASGVRPISLVMYGLHDSSVDSRIIAAKPMFLISNTPHNPWGGNGDASKFSAEGIKVFSYITAGYENGYAEAIPNDLASNLAYIDSIAANDAGVYGIFLDEVDAYPDSSGYPEKGSAFKWDYIKQVSSRAHAKGLKLMCNAGMDSWDDRLMDYCDYLMSSEVYSGAALTASQSKWKSRVVVLSQYTSDAQTAISLTKKATSLGLLAAYAGPYMSLPSWWESYVAGIPLNDAKPVTPPPPKPVNPAPEPVTGCVKVDVGIPLLSPVAPKSGNYPQITCPVSKSGVDCVRAFTGREAGECGLNRWEGNNAIFWCPMVAAGTYSAKCQIVEGTGSNCCASEEVKQYAVSKLKKCSDGTAYSQCSKNRPKYCSSRGALKNACSLCGCPSGKTCQPNGTCKAVRKSAAARKLDSIVNLLKGV